MKAFNKYLRLHWKTLVAMSVGVFLCGITSTFTISYVFQQWESDRSISIIKVSSGILAGMAGAVILAMLIVKTLRGKNDWIKRILVLASAYCILQLVAGSIWGMIGMFSYFNIGMTYGNSQTIMDICIAIWQNLIRVFFLYLLIAWKNNIDWKRHIRDYKMTFLVAVCMSAVPILLNTFESNLITKSIGLVWTCLYIVGFAIVFDNTSRGMEK